MQLVVLGLCAAWAVVLIPFVFACIPPRRYRIGPGRVCRPGPYEQRITVVFRRTADLSLTRIEGEIADLGEALLVFDHAELGSALIISKSHVVAVY